MMLVRQRGVVLIMVVAILATLAIAGTAFVMVMGQESKAASSTLHLAQAEFAARSGLEHAIAVIDESMEKLEPGGGWLVVTPDGVLIDDTTFQQNETVGDATLDSGWHRYFEVFSGGEQLSDPAKWVWHYGGTEVYGAPATLSHAMRGRVIPFPSPDVTIRRGGYAVCVADLDGKLHANAPQWNGNAGSDGSSNPSDLAPCVEAVATLALLSSQEAANLKLESVRAFYSSLSEIARRAGVSTTAKKYALERFFTPYPIPHHEDIAPLDVSGTPTYEPGNNESNITLPGDALTIDAERGKAVVFVESGEAYGVISNTMNTLKVRGDCTGEPADAKIVLVPRPAVNVNTAPRDLLAELVKPIPSFADAADPDNRGQDKAEALAHLICQQRPFAGRHELEDAIFRVVGNQDSTDFMEAYPLNGAVEELKDSTGATVPNLTERQFNDCLNSFAGSLADNDSAFDEPGNPGVYEFDGWEPFGDLIGPAQTGGSRADGSDVTWSTELKFHSRFFHIYVIGRGWNEKAGMPAGVKRLHAIYDAEPGGGKPGKIVWLRWNLSSRGSLTDM